MKVVMAFDSQQLISALAEAVYEAVGKEKYFSQEALSEDEWRKVDLAWQRMKADALEESHGNATS